MARRFLLLLLLLLAGAGSSGCAAVALTLFGVGAGVGTGTGTSYILDSVSYKTFTASEEGLRAATLKTLKRMDITVTEEQVTESGRTIVAAAGDRTIEIELDRLTNRTSRMRVTAKRPWFFRDRATAAEIISQTDRTLSDEPMLARKARPTPTASPLQVTTAANSPGEKVKEAGQAAEPPDKSTWEKIKEGAASVGSSVKDSFAKLFASD